VARTFRRTPCVQSKEKKASTHTSHTIQQNLVAKGKGLGLFIARGGSFVPVRGMNRDQCSAEHHVPRAGALVPVDAMNRDGCPKMNRDRYPGGTNRDRGLSLVPICEPNQDRWLLGTGPKTLFLLVFSLFLGFDIFIFYNSYFIFIFFKCNSCLDMTIILKIYVTIRV
jgi:hypothetical protein